MTYGEWLDEWLRLHSLRVRESTIRGYRNALHHLPDEVRQADVQNVTPALWQYGIDSVARLYPRQAQLMHSAMRKSWNDGVRLQRIPSDLLPYKHVEPVRHRAQERAYLTPAEMSSYVREVRGRKAALPLLLMLLCGLRRGEALGLRWSRIDRKALLLHIDAQFVDGSLKAPKTRTSVRIIPICSEILAIIDDLGDKKCDLVYTGGVKRVYADHRDTLTRAGLDAACTLHGLRHSCATACLNSGADVVTVQHILGHAHFSTTADIYCHALKETERAAITSVATRLEIA